MPKEKRRPILQYDRKKNYDALQAIKDENVSIREASRKYGVPRGTLQDRLHGRVPENCKMGRDSALSKAEEEALVQWLTDLAKCGFARKRDDLLNTVQNIMKAEKRPNKFTNDRPGRCPDDRPGRGKEKQDARGNFIGSLEELYARKKTDKTGTTTKENPKTRSSNREKSEQAKKKEDRAKIKEETGLKKEQAQRKKPMANKQNHKSENKENKKTNKVTSTQSQILCTGCDDELISDAEDDDLKNLGCDMCPRWFHLKCTLKRGMPYAEVATKVFVCHICVLTN